MVDLQGILVPWQDILSPFLLGLPVLPIPGPAMRGHPADFSLVLPVRSQLVLLASTTAIRFRGERLWETPASVRQQMESNQPPSPASSKIRCGGTNGIPYWDKRGELWGWQCWDMKPLEGG